MSATVANGRVFDAFLGDDLGAAHAVPRPLLRRERARRRGRAAPPRADRGVGRARERARAIATSCATCSHDRVASKPAVREVRLAGLMGGVELAPPARRAAVGPARVSAAAIERGVLLRPLGDIVVLMPPLTITSPRGGPHRRRARRRDRRGHCAVTTGAEPGPTRERDAIRASGPLARAARPRRARARRRARRRRPRGRVVRVERLPRPDRTIRRVVAAAHDALDRWGAGSGSARLIVGSRPGAHRARARARELEAIGARRALPDRLRRQPRRAHDVRRPRRARLLRRAEPRVDHRRVPAVPRRRRGLPPRRPRSPRRAARRPGRPPRASS